MKKTLTINLGGIVFYIDDDAYTLLHKYMENLRLYFSNRKGEEEIIADIEGRFAELLSERISHKNQSIVISDIEEIINQVGQPEEIYGEELDIDVEEAKSKKEEHTTKSFTYRRKLYRDPDNKVIGGVASGVAAYFKIDPLIIRLIFLILLFSTAGITSVAYLAMWAIVPLASTAIEKLNMCGEDVTIENIGKQVSEDLREKENFYKAPKSRGAKFLDSLVSILGAILKAVFIFFLIILSPVFLILAFVLFVCLFIGFFSLFVGGASLVGLFGEPLTGLVLLTPLTTIIVSFILIVLPLGFLLYFLLKNVFKLNLKPIHSSVGIILFIVWVIAFILFVSNFSSINWGAYRSIESSYALLSL